MTVNPRRVHARVHAASTILADLVDRLPEAVRNALLESLDPAPAGNVEEVHTHRKGWIADPTGERATSRAQRNESVVGDLTDQLDTLALTLSLLLRFVERWAPTVTVATRCSGGRTVDDWSRPDCGELVETYRDNAGVVHERGHGLCANCRKRRDRFNATRNDVA